ncbi:hypothetical protein [Chryseobacterium gossypii]|uniref:hypothetical protein n=1 Tax=Chryseobacterium gossypii TaxID=3231602 RepID=UPI003525B390
MKNIVLIFSLIVTSFLSAQELLPPPPPATPTAENKILIDELIKVTEFKNYFTDYCNKKVEQAAKENNWDDKKKQEIINSINFKYFVGSIYNAFASENKETLNNAIALFKDINNKKSDSFLKFVPINPMIQYNFEGFVRSLLQGKYILTQ